MPVAPEPDFLTLVAAEIRAQRARLGRTQAQVAADLGVMRQTLAAWEQGEALPTDRDPAHWRRALGISFNDLLRRALS